MEKRQIKFAFFGTPQFAVGVLDELEKAGLLPSLVVTAPDKPRGRKLAITPPEVKVWAQERNIPVLQPISLNHPLSISPSNTPPPSSSPLKKGGGVHEGERTPYDVFVVVAYGKIIPKNILEIPRLGTLNVHPSLLPRLRGASPIQSAILTEEKTGVSIMLLDEEMDHGPIVAQQGYVSEKWPPKASELEVVLAKLGGEMLADTLTKYVAGEITPVPQDHASATYCKKIQKEDGLLHLEGDNEENFRKIQAFNVWPRAYFFKEINGKNMRVIVTDAELRDGVLIIKKVLPEGQNEMVYEEFLKRFE